MDAVMKQKVWAAVEQLCSEKVVDLEMLSDPSRVNAYMVKASFGGGMFQTYELTGYVDQGSHWIERQLVELKCPAWPPIKI